MQRLKDVIQLLQADIIALLEIDNRGALELVFLTGGLHRVGVSWDQASLILYVDGVEVAKKAQSGVPGSVGGLYIGAGKNLEAGSFWSGSGSALRRDESGLIDDVRIYDRAIRP